MIRMVVRGPLVECQLAPTGPQPLEISHQIGQTHETNQSDRLAHYPSNTGDKRDSPLKPASQTDWHTIPPILGIKGIVH